MLSFKECLEKYQDTLGQPASVLEKLKLCLEAWWWNMDLSYEPRSGYYLYGATRATIPIASAQPVSGHEFNCAILAIVLLSHFPKLFTPAEYSAIIIRLLLHDVGEKVTKDIPANGSEKHQHKYIEENKAIDQFFTLLGGDWTEATESIKYKDLARESSEAKWNQQFHCSYRMARFIDLTDKIEALLSMAYLEQHGQSGSFKFYATNVKDEATDRDFEAAKHTGSDAALDIWGYSTVKFAKLRAGQDFDVLFEGLLRLAVQKVRGKDLAWLDRELAHLGQ